MYKEIEINSKKCELMKPVKNAKYGSKTVLTDSCWEYVSLYLQRKKTAGSRDALFYWKQAYSFYLSSKSLLDAASPLTAYYCILNASKALLVYKGVSSDRLQNHGISSVRQTNNNTNIQDTYTAIKGAGVLPELARYYDIVLPVRHYCISDLLYNIPCVHRAYCITFSKTEIYIPIHRPIYVKKEGSKEAWLQFEVRGQYANNKSIKSLPSGFEHDIGTQTKYVIRKKKRFYWDRHDTIENRKKKLNSYNEKIRKNLFYISGEKKLWYIKKDIISNNELSDVASNVLIFAVFHWISELVRYNPMLFNKYMSSRQNWLLHEFITKALDQFVDEIGCEITGQDIMCTGYR